MEHGLGICKGSAEKRARGSRRSGKESRLVRAEIARVRNGAGAWRKGECWDEPKKPYAGRGRDEPRPRGLGASAEGVRRSGDEDCALRASRKREDAEQALGYMSRRALERGRRSGLKEQEESWCGAVRLFDGAQARERYSLLAKDPLRGHKSPICEECRKTNFLLENLAWENAGRSASERFPSDPRTHISPIIVHRALLFEKKGGGRAGWRKDGVPDVGESTRFSRARDDFGDTPDVPRDDEPSARGFGDASDASQTKMPRTLFFKKKGSGKRAGRGVTLPLHGVLRQVVGLILLKIPIEQSHGVPHAWLLANMLGVKKSHVAHRFRGR